MANYRLRLNNCDNDKAMVRTLKQWLNEVTPPYNSLSIDDNFDSQTAMRLETFRRLHNLSDGESVCDAATWLTLGQEVRLRGGFSVNSNNARAALPNSLRNLVLPPASCPLKFDRQKFFDAYRKEFGKLNQSQAEGLEQLLGFIEADKEMCDVRWIAYMLATVFHECKLPPTWKPVWKPVEEADKGRSQKTHVVKGKVLPWYGSPKTIKCDGVDYTHIFYGRGYVQLTHGENYQKVGASIGLGCELVKDPARALEPEIGYKIMSQCMRTGEAYANGFTLGQFLNGEKIDYEGARKIINGTDKKKLIAGYAVKFQGVLELSSV